MTKAEIITIGDELLFGQIIDSNAAWMSEQCVRYGFNVIRRTTVGDGIADIVQAFAEAEKRADIVFTTGGLGATSDDITKSALCQFFNTELELNAQALMDLEKFFTSRGRTISERNKTQAYLPKGSHNIANPVGTACTIWMEKNNKVFVSMPGVPFEMKMMLPDVLEKLKAKFHPPATFHQWIRVAGLPESVVADKIATWENALPSSIKLAYLPSPGSVRLRLTAQGISEKDFQNTMHEECEKIKPLLGDAIVSFSEETTEVAVGKLLRERNLTLAIAESCTGGYLSHLITSVPGSSDYFWGSMIPYAYHIKKSQLGVKPETLEKYGAVSEPTIIEMANVVRARFNSDIGVATSGIAGPGGATPEKPVGLVWIAYSDKHNVQTHKLMLTQDRVLNIQLASHAVLNMIRLQLLKKG